MRLLLRDRRQLVLRGHRLERRVGQPPRRVSRLAPSAGNVGASVTKLIGPALITSMPAAGLLGGALPGGWRVVPVLYAVLLVAMALVRRCSRLRTIARRHGPRAGRDAGATAPAPHLAFRAVLRRGLRCLCRLQPVLPSYYKERLSNDAGQGCAPDGVLHLPGQSAAARRRLALGPLRRAAGHYTVFVPCYWRRWCWPRPTARSVSGSARRCSSCSSRCWASAWASARRRSTSTSRVLPQGRRRGGRAGGTLGALGGFVLPVGFGYLERRPAVRELLLLMTALMASCLLWLHLVVVDIRRHARSPLVAETIGDPGQRSGSVVTLG